MAAVAGRSTRSLDITGGQMEITSDVVIRALTMGFAILVAGLAVWWLKRGAKKRKELGEVLRRPGE